MSWQTEPFIHKLYSEPLQCITWTDLQRGPDMLWCMGHGVYRCRRVHFWKRVTEWRTAKVEAARMRHGTVADVVGQEGLDIMQ